MTTEKNESDVELFREAMADVTPLKAPQRHEPIRKKPEAVASQLEKDNREALSEIMDHGRSEFLETGEELLWLRSGYQARVLKRLRRGHYSVADTIDLHYMDVSTAKQVLLDFLDRSLQRHNSCVRVIHGKGLRSRDLPRLKLMTARVLRKHPRVIAYSSCRPVDGGTGACDVLLSARKGKTA
jgi:DNA-nicking Smr family endonuclease